MSQRTKAAHRTRAKVHSSRSTRTNGVEPAPGQAVSYEREFVSSKRYSASKDQEQKPKDPPWLTLDDSQSLRSASSSTSSSREAWSVHGSRPSRPQNIASVASVSPSPSRPTSGAIEEICLTSNDKVSEVTKDMAVKKHSTAEERTEGPEIDVVCVDLFCGAGGLTEGLLKAGVKVVAGVDFDKACEYPYKANHRGIIFHKGDVAELDALTVAEWFGDAKVKVLAGCAPCQPFSSYSHRYETKGTERWSLLNHFSRLVEELVPDIVTMENVPTVTKHSVFNHFVATLERLKYKVWAEVIDCAEYGLPQRRRRTVLLASRHGNIALNKPSKSRKLRTVADVLSDLPELEHGGSDLDDPLHTASSLSPLNYKRIQASTPGGSWRDWKDKSLIAKCHTKESGKTYPGVYGRMTWEEPAPTLTTQFYGFGNGRFGHPEQDRGLSLREGAILQGFPKRYKFIPKKGQIQFKALGRLIGNAVPVHLGHVIGRSIMRHVKKHVGQPLQSTNLE